MSFQFNLIIETNLDTGKVTAAYFRIRSGRVADTREFARGAVFADFDRKGQLLGIEMLAPCRVSVLDRVAKNEPRPARTFLRSAVPREMVLS